MADTSEKAMTPENGSDLLDEQDQERARRHGQERVVHLEEELQLERRHVGHQGLAAKDGNEIDHTGHEDLQVSRERSDALNVADGGGVMSRYGLEGGLKECAEQVQTEGLFGGDCEVL